MPGFTAHYIFGVEMYHKITDPSIKKMIKQNLGPYRFGLQGPDLFFYNPFHVLYSDDRNIGKLMHETKVSQFFRNYLNLAEKLRNASDRATALSYFYGFVCHYTLDTIIHPYVYDRSDYVPDDERSAKDSFSMHTYIEGLMDTILLNDHFGKKPSKFHQTRTLSLSKREYQLLSALMVKAVNLTYFNGKKEERIFQTHRFSLLLSILSIKLGTWILHDKVGIKKKLTNFLEKRFMEEVVVSHLIGLDYYDDSIDANNKSKALWKNPWDTSITSNKSVSELMDDAAIKFVDYEAVLKSYAIAMLSKDKKVRREKKEALLTTLGNLSYHSGLPCE